MNDDWRVKITCPSTTIAEDLGTQLQHGGFEHGLGEDAAQRVIVSVDGHELFLYAGSREQAQAAIETVRGLAAKSNVTPTTELRRWHPVAEEWVDPDQPLPATGSAADAEHQELIEQEREESSELHAAAYEVRVATASHRETVALAEQLDALGVPYLRRWRYLLVGAADEQAAAALADQIRGLAPAGSRVEVEATLAAVAQDTPANPFAVFGGLGG